MAVNYKLKSSQPVRLRRTSTRLGTQQLLNTTRNRCQLLGTHTCSDMSTLCQQQTLDKTCDYPFNNVTVSTLLEVT
ncbi:hypothetical protein J6590_092842 [Homalodisca vitripennis]|nr:hypothetical protein J6590_092842 [Homalodisca vitripennis]